MKMISILNLTRKDIIKYIAIVAGGMIIGLLMTKLGDFGNIVEDRSAINNNYMTGQLLPGCAVEQCFVPTHDHLESVDIIVDRQADMAVDGQIEVSVRDENGNILGADSRNISDMYSGAAYEFEVNADLRTGDTYYLTISGTNTNDVAPCVIYRTTALDRISENVILTYAGAIVENGSLACEYKYILPVAKLQLVMFIIFGMILVSVLCELVENILAKNTTKNEVSAS